MLHQSRILISGIGKIVGSTDEKFAPDREGRATFDANSSHHLEPKGVKSNSSPTRGGA